MEKSYLFISYNRGDSLEMAKRLASDLKMTGIEVWLDVLNLKPGTQWDRETEKALRESHTVLIFLTPNSIESDNVMDEISIAIEDKKRVIPIMIQACRVPMRLTRFQYIDFINGYDNGLLELHKALDNEVAYRAYIKKQKEESEQLETQKEEYKLANEEAKRKAVENEEIRKKKAAVEKINLEKEKLEKEQLAKLQEEKDQAAKEVARLVAIEKENKEKKRLAKLEKEKDQAAKEAERLAFVEEEKIATPAAVQEPEKKNRFSLTAIILSAALFIAVLAFVVNNKNKEGETMPIETVTKPDTTNNEVTNNMISNIEVAPVADSAPKPKPKIRTEPKEEPQRLKKELEEKPQRLKKELEEEPQRIEELPDILNTNAAAAEKAYNEGVSFYEKRDYNDAIASFSKTISLNKNYADAFNYRASTYDNKQEYDLAIKDYTEAIRLDPKFANTYNNRGNSYLKKKEYDLAIQDYTEAIRLNPKDADFYNNRGISYRNKKEYDLAIQDYTEAIRLDPNYVYAYYSRGVSYDNKNEYDLAIQDYETALRLNPNVTNAANNLKNAKEAKAKQGR